MNRDEQNLSEQVSSAVQHLTSLLPLIPDMFTLAYDKHVGEKQRVSRPEGYANLPNRRFKMLLDRVWQETLRIEALRNEVFNELAAGPGADLNLRGSRISPAELEQAKRNQQKRSRRGEYTPVRHERQEDYPGRVCEKCDSRPASRGVLCDGCYMKSWRRRPQSTKGVDSP